MDKIKIRGVSRLRLSIFVALFAVAGLTTLYFAQASNPNAPISTDPNTVIVQYSLPHTMMPVDKDNLPISSIPPFTLYGNGLLVCGKNHAMQFMPNMNMAMSMQDNQATSRQLTPTEIQNVINQIVQTGFLSLKKEYFAQPINGSQHTIRLSLNRGDHFVLFYNDVPAPAAYAKTLAILEGVCKQTTQPYVPAQNAQVEVKKDANIQGKPQIAPSALTPATNLAVKQTIQEADQSVAPTTAQPANSAPYNTTLQVEAMQSPAALPQVTGRTSTDKAVKLVAPTTIKASTNFAGVVTSMTLHAKRGSCQNIPTITVKVDGKQIGNVLSISSTNWTAYQIKAEIAKGAHTIELVYKLPVTSTSNSCKAEAHVDALAIQGYIPPPTTPFTETVRPVEATFRSANIVGGKTAAYKALRLYNPGGATKSISLKGDVTNVTLHAKRGACTDVPTAVVKINTKQVASFKITSTNWTAHQAKVAIPKGNHTLVIDYVLAKKTCDAAFAVDSLVLHGTIPAAVVSDESAQSNSNTPLHIADNAVTGGVAANLMAQMKGKQRAAIKEGTKNYEVGVKQSLPTIKNKLVVDYKQIRAQQPNDFTTRSKSAAVIQPGKKASVRIVALLPATGGDANQAKQVADRIGPNIHKWYCEQVGKCYNYDGVSVMRGSQSAEYYNTCHRPSGCPDQLAAILSNVWEKDAGTIFEANTATLLITTWATDGLSKNACGRGYVGYGLSVFDATTADHCKPGHSGAHELGHNFGLPHTGNGTLMDGDPYAQYSAPCGVSDPGWVNCSLDPAQATQLTSSDYFSEKFVKQPYIAKPYTMIVLAQHPNQEVQYNALSNDKVNFVFRSIYADTNQADIARWEQGSTRYFYTAASSDFVQYQGRSSPYASRDEGIRMLSAADRTNCLGIYIHEMVALRAQQNGWNWGTALHDIDWGLIDGWASVARANGKKIIWSEPAGGWEAMQSDPAVQGLLAKWGDTIVPMFATNFENTASGYQMGKARKAASEVAGKYGMPLGESVQSWYFEENDNPNIKGDNIPPAMVRDLMKYGIEKNATYFQIEGVHADMSWGKPFMQGVHMFSQQLSHGTLGMNHSARVPIYQMWNNRIMDHYYPNSDESRSYARAIYGFEDQGVAGYADIYQTPGTLPLYELYSAAYTDHFYTTDWNQINAALGNWPYYRENAPQVRHVGYIPTTQVIGSKALFQLWYPGRAGFPGDADHFYTTDHWQKDNAMQENYGVRYQYQGIAGYLYTSP